MAEQVSIMISYLSCAFGGGGGGHEDMHRCIVNTVLATPILNSCQCSVQEVYYHR